MTDWSFIYRKYRRHLFDWRYQLVKRLNRRYDCQCTWTFDSWAVDAAATEDFNDPIILQKSAGDFIDCGANIGLWTVRAAPFYRKVVAVEPNPANYANLLKNVKLNKCSNVECFKDAVGSIVGEQVFYLNGNGDSSLLLTHMGIPSTRPIKVLTLTLDYIVTLWNLEPTLLKLDVEGTEADVLLGARDTIDKWRPSLLVEVHQPTTPEMVMASVKPNYDWEVRWHYLNRQAFPEIERQAHLYGRPSER